MFFAVLRKPALKCYLSLYFWNYIRGSAIAFYVSYILSRTMYEVPIKELEKTIPTTPNTGTQNQQKSTYRVL